MKTLKLNEMNPIVEGNEIVLRTESGILLLEPEEKSLSIDERVQILEDKVNAGLEVPVYTLNYRKNNHLHQKLFRFRGNIVEARNRARKHCSVMQYTFIIVNYGIADLDFQEDAKRNGNFDGDSESLN